MDAGYGYDRAPPDTQGMVKGGELPEVVTSQPGPPAYYSAPPQHNIQMAPVSNTTVIVQQQQPVLQMGPRVWSSGICDCFDDCESCLCGFFFHTCLLAQISGKLGESCCVPFCVPGGGIALRVKLRTMFNIQGTIMDDCCMAAFCPPCMACQMSRELKFVTRTNPSNYI